MKIYLAGPDIFRPDAAAWAASAKEMCLRYGFEAMISSDHGATEPGRIFQANIDMIRKAQIIVANLDPFRGAEPDSGTCFELGYAMALDKKICGYVTHLNTVVQRVQAYESHLSPLTSVEGLVVDREGWLIEDFGLTLNLMLAMSSHIVEGGLEACLQSIRPRASIPSPKSA